jgi:hypothetical protein
MQVPEQSSHIRLPRSEIYPKIGDIFAAFFSGGSGQVKTGKAGKKVGIKRDETSVLVVMTACVSKGFPCRWNACEAASYNNHLPLWLVQAVQALPGVDEIMALDKELFFL